MSGMQHSVGSPIRAHDLVRPARGVLQLLRERVRQPSFWVVQTGIVVVTALHAVIEVGGLLEGHGEPGPSLARMIVVLYILPIVHAGFVYGFEGALAAGSTVVLLAAPNLLLWHREAFEWLGELLFVAFVVGVGVAIAVPVEHERRQRARAEQAIRRASVAGRQLRLVNDVVSRLVPGIDRPGVLPGLVERVASVLDLDWIGIVTWSRTGDGPARVEAVHGVDAAVVIDVVAEHHRPADQAPGTADVTLPDGTLLIPFRLDGDTQGGLVVHAGRDVHAAERHLLRAIATQIGVAVEKAHLVRSREAAMRAYVQAATRAQEEERRRIARDLHDVATHELLLARRDLEDLDLSAAEGLVPSCRRGLDRVSAVITYLRRFSRDLRPTVLEPLGLAPAVSWLVDQLDDESGVAVSTTVMGTPRRLDDEVELALYRIAEEALRNALTHADPSQVQLALDFDEDSVSLQILDDGCGWQVWPGPGGDGVPAGLGLLGMSERAELIGGEFVVDSHPGTGTCVSVRVSTSASIRRDQDAAATPPALGVVGGSRR